MLPDDSEAPSVAELARALRMEAAVTLIADHLRPLGARIMPLKGPAVQRRLLGTPAAYPSDDVDVLIGGLTPRATTAALRRTGWEFSPLNGRLWRLDGAASFKGHGVHVDVHWGLHVGLVPSHRMRPLVKQMWASARQADGGWYEPSITPLATYLCLHSADRFDNAGKRALTAAAVEESGDWRAIVELAAQCKMAGVAEAMQLALQTSTPPPDVLVTTYGARNAAIIRLIRSRLPKLLRRSSASVRYR
jgi:hypothetical protein